jgi:flagellar assembly factor FliW
MLAGALTIDETGRPGEPGAGADAVVLTFARPLIGLEQSTRYAIRPLGADWEPYTSLVSLDEPSLAFLVVPPAALFEDYVIEIPEEDCAQLELEDAADVVVLLIVRRRGLPTPVVNLVAPIVVNRRTRMAAQVVLQESGYGLMVPVDAGTARPQLPSAS